MVRHYIGKYVEGYFSQRMHPGHHALVLCALGVVLVPVIFFLFALQLGAVVLSHVVLQYVVDSWMVFMVAGAVMLAVAGDVLIKGMYELYSFFLFTWSSALSWYSRLTMSLGFIVDFVLSDVVMAASIAVIAYMYVLVALTRGFGVLGLLNLSLALAFIGVFFQVAFMSAYTRAKQFSRVVNVSKRFIFTYPQEVGASQGSMK